MQTAGIFETPYYCKIEVRGHLDSRAAGGFNGLTVEHDDGVTVLEGLVRNQIDLCDYILRLHNLNLPVASLRRERQTRGTDDNRSVRTPY